MMVRVVWSTKDFPKLLICREFSHRAEEFTADVQKRTSLGGTTGVKKLSLRGPKPDQRRWRLI